MVPSKLFSWITEFITSLYLEYTLEYNFDISGVLLFELISLYIGNKI